MFIVYVHCVLVVALSHQEHAQGFGYYLYVCPAKEHASAQLICAKREPRSWLGGRCDVVVDCRAEPCRSAYNTTYSTADNTNSCSVYCSICKCMVQSCNAELFDVVLPSI